MRADHRARAGHGSRSRESRVSVSRNAPTRAWTSARLSPPGRDVVPRILAVAHAIGLQDVARASTRCDRRDRPPSAAGRRDSRSAASPAASRSSSIVVQVRCSELAKKSSAERSPASSSSSRPFARACSRPFAVSGESFCAADPPVDVVLALAVADDVEGEGSEPSMNHPVMPANAGHPVRSMLLK